MDIENTFEVGDFVIINNYWYKDEKVKIAELISGIREGRRWFRFHENDHLSDAFPIGIIKNKVV